MNLRVKSLSVVSLMLCSLLEGQVNFKVLSEVTLSTNETLIALNKQQIEATGHILAGAITADWRTQETFIYDNSGEKADSLSHLGMVMVMSHNQKYGVFTGIQYGQDFPEETRPTRLIAFDYEHFPYLKILWERNWGYDEYWGNPPPSLLDNGEYVYPENNGDVYFDTYSKTTGDVQDHVVIAEREHDEYCFNAYSNASGSIKLFLVPNYVYCYNLNNVLLWKTRVDGLTAESNIWYYPEYQKILIDAGNANVGKTVILDTSGKILLRNPIPASQLLIVDSTYYFSSWKGIWAWSPNRQTQILDYPIDLNRFGAISDRLHLTYFEDSHTILVTLHPNRKTRVGAYLIDTKTNKITSVEFPLYTAGFTRDIDGPVYHLNNNRIVVIGLEERSIYMLQAFGL